MAIALATAPLLRASSAVPNWRSVSVAIGLIGVSSSLPVFLAAHHISRSPRLFHFSTFPLFHLSTHDVPRSKRVSLGEGYDGSNISLSHQFLAEHGMKHLDPREPYAHLTEAELELLPTLWRSPDRVVATRDPNRTQLELDTIDGGCILAIVDRRNGFKSIQKRTSPGGSDT